MGCGSSHASNSKYNPDDHVVSPAEVRDDTTTTRKETAASTKQTQEKRPITEEIASAKGEPESHARQLNSLSLKLGENVSDSLPSVDLPAVVTKTSITPKWFFSFYAQLIEGALPSVDGNFTTAMLVEQIIKARTVGQKCRYTACAEFALQAAAKKVECFVAHAWSMPLSQLVGCLQAAVHDNDHPLTEDSPIWLDMLELNPHDSPQVSQLMELRQVVSSCDYVLLSLDPSFKVLQRAWPRFAAYEAFSQEIPLHFLHDDIDWACFQEEIYQIDLLQPQAADDPFQSIVANQLVSDWGDSQEDVNSILTTFLLEAAYRHVRKVYEACTLENDEKLVAARNCAALMQAVQLLTEAIEMRQGALRLAEELYSDSSEKILPDLEGLAEAYKCHKDFNEAEQLLLRCKVIKEIEFGPRDQMVVSTSLELARVMENQDRCEESFELFKICIERTEENLGKLSQELPKMLLEMCDVAVDCGKTSDAFEGYARAMEIMEQHEMCQDPMFAACLNNQARLLSELGKFSEAEPLYKQALQVREQTDGPDSLAVAESLNNVAVLLKQQGKYTEALPVYERSLEIRREVLGEDHPDVAQSLNNLAGLLSATGKLQEALPLQERALAIREKALGPDHCDTTISRMWLADTYQKEGHYNKALPIFIAALEANEKLFGEEHPTVVASINNVAVLYTDMGQYEKALPLRERCIKIGEKLLSPNHPELAVWLNNMASLLSMMGKASEAEPLQLRALEIRESCLGAEHPDTVISRMWLADSYQRRGAYDEALPIFRMAVESNIKSLGYAHPTVAASINNVAVLLSNMGKHDEAIASSEECLEIASQHYNEEHPSYLNFEGNYGIILKARGENARALKHINKALTGLLAKNFDSTHVWITKFQTHAEELLRSAVPAQMNGDASGTAPAISP